MIDLDQTSLGIIKNILVNHVSTAEIIVFGSRVTGKAKVYSDIDIVVKSSYKIERSKLNRLKESFVDSKLKIRVDVLDWYRLTKNFQDIIARDGETLSLSI